MTSRDRDSPFRQHRHEYEGSHLYFLPPGDLEVLTRDVSTYMVGTRGTGKTTLLKAMSWSERLSNPSLRRQLGERPFADGLIGLYLKLPQAQADVFETWLREEPDHVQGRVFATYLDLIWIQLALEAVANLAVKGVLDISAAEETASAGEVSTMLSDLLRSTSTSVSNRPRTFLEAADQVRSARRQLEELALRRVGLDRALDRVSFPADFGGLGRSIATELAEACGLRDERRWHFRVCMDEGECLSDRQVLVLNTMVRVAEWPTFFIASFVSRPDDVTSTYIPNLTLSNADRQVIERDSISDREFRVLVEGVSAVRIASRTASPERALDELFDLSACLGSPDINDLLVWMLSESVSPNARQLLNASRHDTAAAGHLDEGSEPSPAIIEHYLQRQKPVKKHEDEEQWEVRRRSSAGSRKKMVAAYLSICAELGIGPRYAGYRMVLQMSDKCIRDYLWQMHEIFVAANRSVEDLCESRVPLDVQHKALRTASNNKVDRIDQYVVSAPSRTALLIRALSELTATLQSQSPSGAHLRSPERGRFVLDTTAVDEHIIEAIEDATRAGYVRIVEREHAELKFRMHTSLAAAFGFSYRGAYYDVPLDSAHIEAIVGLPDEDHVPAAVEAIARSIEGATSEQPPLF